MIFKLLNKIIGDPNEKVIKRCRQVIPTIHEWEERFRAFEEPEVKAKTQEFRDRIQAGENVDKILPEAFALHKTACKLLVNQTFSVRGQDQVWNMVPFDVQLIGGMILHEGKIAEMKTGEGKTLVATLPLYLNALSGKGSYLVTVNDYLAQRDSEWMGFLFRFLGLTVGVIHHGQSAEEKRMAYSCDITYGTNNEFGFDYLRDNMATSLSQCVQRGLHYAIVDEVDSILIDEARTPLIISAAAEESTDKYMKYSRLVTQLENEVHYKIDEKARSCILTDEGVKKMESLLGMGNIYTEAGATEVHHIEQSLKANMIFRRDVDYMVTNGEIVIIDEFTGRLMSGRRYSDGLHQAIEAKEGVEIKRESKTLATITFQNYFRIFEKLAGMTGTAITEAEEFEKIYGLETTVIPTHRPIQRKDVNDLVYKNVLGKFQAVTKRVKELQEIGQPVLVGTISVEKSEILSNMFQQSGIRHHVLNAKHHEKEAEIVANAGAKHAVTIATNMAGRGTDIKISDEVKELGGLCIIGTERHESRRIDHQLRGRSGRQGDPGYSQFYVSMEDELMRLFGGDRMKSIMDRLKVPDDMPIENGLISRSIESSQKRVEGHNFDIRKHLVEYDDVMNKHRSIIYSRRRKILENENLHETILDLIANSAKRLVTSHASSRHPQDWDLTGLSEELHLITGIPRENFQDIFRSFLSTNEVHEHVRSLMQEHLESKKSSVSDEASFFGIEKTVYLRTIDRLWMDHIDSMMKLREQVSLRGYAQKDPLIEYKKEGFSAFEELLGKIQYNTVQTLMRMEVKVKLPEPTPLIHMTTNEAQVKDIDEGDRELIPKPSPEQHFGNAGRNDVCPCGSGMKFKKCHGV